MACAYLLVACGGGLPASKLAEPSRPSGAALCLPTGDSACSGSAPKSGADLVGLGAESAVDGGCRVGQFERCEQLCATHNWDACSKLGFMYDPTFHQGGDIRPDSGKALSLYTRSCEGGSSAGCFNLANAYERGSLLPKSLPMARDLFSKVCERGESEACVRLGKIELGIDRTRALTAFRKACLANDAEGCLILATTLLDGPPDTDHAEALSALITACTRPRTTGRGIFGQAYISELSEKACQRWRTLQGAQAPASPPL